MHRTHDPLWSFESATSYQVIGPNKPRALGEAEGVRALKMLNTFAVGRLEGAVVVASFRVTVTSRFPEGEREVLEVLVLAVEIGRLEWLNVADRLKEV